jgi:hypothetical protein
MHLQNLDSKVQAKPADPQPLPAQAANGAPSEAATRESDFDDLLDYHAVPPRRVMAISVRYRHVGRGRPLPYQDEEGEE